MSTVLENARHYVNDRGWAVIPVWSVTETGACRCGNARCPSPGKHPIRSGWTSLEKAATTVTDTWSYWGEGEAYPDANIGLLTGHASGVWVLDADTYREPEALERLVAHGGAPLDLTLIHRSGSGGVHFFYRMPEDVTIGSYRLEGFDGIDVRGDGGQIVLPPSVSGGGRYEVMLNYPVVDAPAWLLDLVRRSTPSRPLAVSIVGAEEIRDERIPGPVLRLLQGEIPTEADDGQGLRYRYLARFVWTCKEQGLTVGQAITLVERLTPVMGKFEGREAERVATLWSIHEQRRQRGLVLEGVPALPPEQVREQIEAVVGRGSDLPLTDDPLDAIVARDWLAHRIDWAEAWDRVAEEPEWTWPPFFQKGRLYAFYSAPKLGKSLVLLEGCAALASGRTPPGGQAGERPLKIVYCDRENSDEDVVDRLKEMGYDYKDIEQNFHYFIHPSNSMLSRQAHAETFLRMVDMVEPDLVVFDTTMRFVEGDENSTEPFHQFYNACLSPLKARRITVVRVDHVGKDERKGQRGSSAKTGDVDGAYRLARLPGSGLRFKITCTESRTRHHPEWVTLTRHLEPRLVHEVTRVHRLGEDPGDELLGDELDGEEIGGPLTVREALLIEKCIEALDELHVPLDAGRPTIQRLLGEKFGHGFRASTLASAIKQRRHRAMVSEAEMSPI